MVSKGILNWLFTYMLEHQFKNSRREMAIQLRVSERTLNHALNSEQAETALLFEQLLGYAMEHSIRIDSILDQYRQSGG